MAQTAPFITDRRTHVPQAALETATSAVSWGAVVAGSFIVAALWFILMPLGMGVGLSSISPWSNAGVSAAAVSTGAIIWLIVVQIIASSMGGYLTGRLRAKWASVHTHEVYFRDTAHGFLAWSVGLVIMVAFLASATTAMIGRAAGTPAGTESAGRTVDPNAYFVDSLLRTDHPVATQDDAQVRAEVGIIFANGIRQGVLPSDDRSYLDSLVATRTGLSQPEADQRVSAAFDQARQAADTARRAIAHSLYWLFLALLVGAFCASYAATMGGRQRDRVVPA